MEKRSRIKWTLSKEEFEELYIGRKMTDVQIAKYLGCNKQTVWRRRKDFGIPKVEKWERHDFLITPKQWQIILGTLLGDGHLTQPRYKGLYSSNLEVSHGPKQKAFVYWKYEQLKNLMSSPPKPISGNKHRIRSFYHPFFKELHNIFYKNGKKVVTREVLNELSPLGLAIWYMDDGHTGCNPILYTCSFTLEENKMIQQWLLERFNIESTITDYEYNRIEIVGDSRLRFLNLIKPHCIKSFNYKFNNKHTKRFERMVCNGKVK